MIVHGSGYIQVSNYHHFTPESWIQDDDLGDKPFEYVNLYAKLYLIPQGLGFCHSCAD